MLVLNLEETKEKIEQELDRLLPLTTLPYNELYKAARYSLLGGGKRLRPLLTVVCAEMLGADPSVAMAPACALELIHTYSLIHDDLPCMDDDDLRRGQPTLHKAFSEEIAVLTGDFLLTRAFEIVVEAPELTDRQKVSLTALLAKRAGAEGMVGGQVIDVTCDQEEMELSKLEFMHLHKTGALLAAALEAGGIMASASPSCMEKLRELGQQLGLAFQIVDDLLDSTADEEALGKPVGSDCSNNRSTYLSLLGMERSQECLRKLQLKTDSILERLPGDHTVLQDLANRLIDRAF